MINNGEILALLVAKGFQGSCGPCGNKDPEVNGNELFLYSQAPGTGYCFGNDGSVEIFFENSEEMKEFLERECFYSEEEAAEYVDNPKYYNSVLELLEDSEDGWFISWDHPDLTKVICAFLELIKNE